MKRMNKMSILKKLLNPIFAILGGILGTFAFPPYDYSFTIFVSFIILNYFIFRKKHQAKYTWLFLTSLYFPTIFWIHTSMTEYSNVPLYIATVFILLFSLYLSCYHTLSVFLANKLFRGQLFIKNVFIIPAFFVISDYLVGHLFSGFPWLYIGYTQTTSYVKSLAPIGGVYLINLFIYVFCALLVYSIFCKNIKTFACALIMLTIPSFAKDDIYTTEKDEITVAMVQGNIPQQIKWDRTKINDIFQVYYQESQRFFTGQESVDILIWPESAFPDLENYLANQLDALDRVSKEQNMSFISGIQYYDVGKKSYFNAVLGIGLQDLENKNHYIYGEGNRYYKRHLVPIGEKVPFEDILRKLGPIFNMPMSSFTPGDEIQKNILAKGNNIATAICYEIAFPDELIANVNNDTSLILTVSNDGWFGTYDQNNQSYKLSRGPSQHANIAKMRAIELQKPVLRDTNNGLTIAYDYNGNTIGKYPYYKVGTLKIDVKPRIGMTPFNSHGLLIVISIIGFMLLISFSYILLLMMMTTKKNK